jgi:SAM-dependent methyltransferase
MDVNQVAARMTEYFEGLLAAHGDDPRSVDWTNPVYLGPRYEAMLGVMAKTGPYRLYNLLDLGCGLGGLYGHMRDNWVVAGPAYTGIDVSGKMVEAARAKYPGVDFRRVDLLGGEVLGGHWDYVVMNGVFTERLDVGHNDMWEYMRRLVDAAWGLARVAVAFNVTSWHVDEHNPLLFHVPFDSIARWLCPKYTRLFAFRNDYHPCEYTVYAYKPVPAGT